MGINAEMPQISADSDDPLTRAMAPPPNETIQERDARIHREREAKRVSDEIDEELRKGCKKGTKPVKILLLGQYFISERMKVLIFLVCRPERIRYEPVHGLREFDLSTLNREDHDAEEFSID